MNRAWLVLAREVRETVCHRWFVLGNLLAPVALFVVGTALGTLLGVDGSDRAERRPPRAEVAELTEDARGRFAVVDEVGGLGERVAALLAEGGVEVVAVIPPDPAQLDALVVRVRAGDVDGYVRLHAATVADGSHVWHAPRPPDRHAAFTVREAVRFAVLEHLWDPEGDGAVTRALAGGGYVGFEPLESISPVATELGLTGEDRRLLGAIGLMPILLALGGLATWISASTSKELQRGLLELLACSLTPRELVLGKAVGAVVTAGCAVALWSVFPLLRVVAGGTMADPEVVQALAMLLPFAGWAGAIVAAHALALSFVLVAAAVSRPAGSDPQYVHLTLLGVVAMAALRGTFLALDDTSSDPFVYVAAVLPGAGAPVVWARLVQGAPPWQLVAALPLAVLVGWGAALGTARVLRTWSALGGLPRSVAELRAAWRT